MHTLAHIGMVVKDCERSIDFYNQVLGCKVVNRLSNNDLIIVELQTGSLVIELLQYLSPPDEPRGAGPIDHLAFTASDIDAEIDRLRKHGVVFLTEEPRLGLNGNKLIFFIGPDGERIELLETGPQAK